MDKESIERLIANNPNLAKLVPMPASFYKKYNVEPPKPVDFKEYMATARPLATGEGELRPIAPGGVRPLLEPEAHEDILQTLPDSGEVPENPPAPETSSEDTS